MKQDTKMEIPLDILCMQLSDLTIELLKLIETGGKTTALSIKMKEVELLQARIKAQQNKQS